jgi:spore maturation protein CgeB
MPEHVVSGKTTRLEVPKALDPNDLAVVVEDLFQPPDKPAQMGDSMKQRVKRRFTMENTISSFLKLIKEWTLDKDLDK